MLPGFPNRSPLAWQGERSYDCLMRTTPRLLAFLFAGIVAASLSSAGAKPDEVAKEKGLLDRLMNPDRGSKSAYEGQVFKSGGEFSDKKVSIKEFAGSKNFESKTYETKSFEGSKKGWLGNLLFPEKKLPESLQGVASDSGKTFASKGVPVKDFDGNGKASSFSSKGAFETKEVNLKGKTQGDIDNDPHLQEAVKKGLTIDDVKKLLNKPGSSSQ